MSDGLHKRGRIWHFGWSGPDGVRRTFTTKTESYALAKQIQARRIEEFKAAILPTEIGRLGFKDAAEAWFYRASLSMSANTQRNARSMVRRLSRQFSGLTVGEITPAKVCAYPMARTPRVSNAMVNNELRTLRVILRHVKGWTPSHSESFKPLHVSARSPRTPLTEVQLAALLRAARARPSCAWLCQIITLAAHTGLRSCEIKGLRLADVNMNAPLKPTLSIRRATTKTESGERSVMLDNQATAAVQALLELAGKCGASRPSDFLLPSQPVQGGFEPTRPLQSWSKAWRTLCRAAGLEGVHFHDLRHSYITGAVEAGVSLEVLRRQVGHVSEAESRYYAQVRDSAMAEAVERIERHTERAKPVTPAFTGEMKL